MTPDIQLLQQALAESTDLSLWFADENTSGFIPTTFNGSLSSNRFDIVQELRPFFINTQFSDFDFANAATGAIDQVIFRIAKEKAVNLHIISEAFRQLGKGGRLILIGYKNEGISSLLTRIEENYECQITISKHKNQLQRLDIVSSGQQSPGIDEAGYAKLQETVVGDTMFFSKPGLFGWDKIDKGSELLIESLKANHTPLPGETLLDLGCGYGYLSIKAMAMGFKHIDATDNNAAAIKACARNFAHYHIKGDVLADNHAEHQIRQYDLVLCNPPFHKGFGHHKDLTEIFTREACRLLKKGGEAWFVTNQFIGIEKYADRLFESARLLQKKDGFKVLLFKK